MTLYEVDLDKLAVPVKSMEGFSSKRKLKEPKEPKAQKETNTQKEPKEKKPRVKKVKVDTIAVKTEEAAVEEAPIAEKIEVDEEIEKEVKELADAMEAETKSKKVRKTKEASSPVLDQKPRVPRQKKDPAVPPQWFAKYVEGVKKEQATLKPEKVAPKQIKEEAKEAASKSWNNGLTRNRVENEVNGHMSRMYSMIFSK